MTTIPRKTTGLVAFVRTIESGSFSAASRLVGSSQSAISKGVVAIERRLGAKLIQRSTGTPSPTGEGQANYERVPALIVRKTRIFEEDKVIVETQRPECLPLDSVAEVHFPVDRGSLTNRRALCDIGFSHFFYRIVRDNCFRTPWPSCGAPVYARPSKQTREAILGIDPLRPVLILAALALPVHVANAGDNPKLDLSADVRVRLEQDWDSQTATGSKRLNRARSRIRARVNAALDLGDGFRLFGRVRTGAENSQQNANITFADFDHNPVDRFNISADRFSLAWQKKAGGAEVGRMAFPYFTQNEYFWDGDINPLGVAGNLTLPLSLTTKLRFNAGSFLLPVGLSHYSGQLYAGQAVATHGPATLAAGLFRFESDAHDPDHLTLLDDNGSRDYSVLALNGQYRVSAGRKPVALGVDFYRNLQGYRNSTDAISRANDNQRTGFVLSAAWGDTNAAKHVQLGYRYFHMERLAVDSSYSHDDLARLGSPPQAALSDLQGSDLYANYALTRKLMVGARMIFARRITTIEDGKRARLDVTYRF
ncbi:MAG: Porin-like protein [Bradyrhizobium sp.]|nr:Porin-like protein [Bradyrhizobium sp.]